MKYGREAAGGTHLNTFEIWQSHIISDKKVKKSPLII